MKDKSKFTWPTIKFIQINQFFIDFLRYLVEITHHELSVWNEKNFI